MKLSYPNVFMASLPGNCGRHAGLQAWLYIWCSLLLISHTGNACVFPAYVQNNSTDGARDWRGLIKDQYKEISLKYMFQKDLMEVISSDSYVKPYSRVCIQAYGNDRFLVAHEQKGQTRGRYTCMQIVRRSSSILQIREAKLSERMGRDLCNEQSMSLDGWLIMDTKSVMNARVDCSLNGGFNMQVYDKILHKGVCDGNVGETRLESECLLGEGLSFYFRQTSCVPDGLYMYANQRTYCLANWEDGHFKFSLLKHDTMDYLWVLRYPNVMESDGTFTAYLMKDLYATSERSMSVTHNYLSISMSKQEPRTLDSLCYDDYEICSVLKDPCSYSEDIARTCAKTCGFCTDNSASLCQFPLQINGTWVDGNQPDKGQLIHINSTTMDIVGIEKLHCIDWNGADRLSRAVDGEAPTGVTPTHHHHMSEQMLVSVSTNGCRPRFTCAKYTKMPSNTLFLQLSQAKLWPLIDNKEDPYTCSKFVYTSNRDVDKNPFRTRHSNLFITEHINNTVTCDLNDFKYYDVLFKDGVRCSGQLKQTASKDNVHLSFPECSVQRLRHKFTCLEHSRFPPENDMLLITITHESTPKVHCWLFPKRPDNIFHIIESEQCNALMKRKIRKGRLRPIATFTRDPTKKVVIPEQEIIIPVEPVIIKHIPPEIKQIQSNDTLIILETLDTISSSNSNSIEATDTMPSLDDGSNNNNTIQDGNYTVSSDSKNGNSSPVVVAAVIITLIVFQIPLLCKCKCV